VYTQSTLAADQQRRKRRRTLFAALAAVLAVAVSAGAWLLRDRDPQSPDKPSAAAAPSRLDVRETVEKQPRNTTGAMAFRFSLDDMSPGERRAMPGMWATDKILAKGINRTLVGFRIGTDAAPGDEKWKLQFAGPICGYTRHTTAENRTAVLSRASNDDNGPCDHVAFVDLDDGRKLWEHPFTPTGGATPSVTLTRATVAVTWGGGSQAYDMDTGRQLWRTKAVKATKAAGTCQDYGAAGGRALLVLVSCFRKEASATSWEGTTYQVRKVAPRTGRNLWTYSVASGVREVKVPSSEPAVLAVAAGDTGFTELLSLDDDGENRATIRLESGQYLGECTDALDYRLVDDCPTIPVGAGQAFLRSKEYDDGHPDNWITGFDLETGKTVKKFDSGPNELLYPVRMSGDRLLALRESSDRISPMALVDLDPETGTETPYLYFGLPPEAESFTLTESNDILVRDGRLFFGAKEAVGPSAKDGKAWIWLALGIESAAERTAFAGR
jgi:outer membrane protein assembly factor BamB